MLLGRRRNAETRPFPMPLHDPRALKSALFHSKHAGENRLSHTPTSPGDKVGGLGLCSHCKVGGGGRFSTGAQPGEKSIVRLRPPIVGNAENSSAIRKGKMRLFYYPSQGLQDLVRWSFRCTIMWPSACRSSPSGTAAQRPNEQEPHAPAETPTWPHPQAGSGAQESPRSVTHRASTGQLSRTAPRSGAKKSEMCERGLAHPCQEGIFHGGREAASSRMHRFQAHASLNRGPGYSSVSVGVLNLAGRLPAVRYHTYGIPNSRRSPSTAAVRPRR